MIAREYITLYSLFETTYTVSKFFLRLQGIAPNSHAHNFWMDFSESNSVGIHY